MLADHAGRISELGGGVFALSSLVNLSEPISWVSPSATGFDPSNCYLIRDGAEAHLVDTGLRAHGSALVGQLHGLLDGGTAIHLALTRVEPDTLGSVDTLAEKVPLVRISSQSNVIPLDYLGPISAGYPGIAISNGLHAGDSISLDGGRRLLAVEPPVRTLPTLWYFDERARVLFTSDFFGGVHLSDPGSWTPTSDGTEVGEIRRHLLAKFDWLALADSSEPIRRLESVMTSLPIAAIAPGHGLWTIGEENVRRRFEATREALLSLGSARNHAGNQHRAEG